MTVQSRDFGTTGQWNLVDKYRKFISVQTGGIAYYTTLDNVYFATSTDVQFYETVIVPHFNISTKQPIDQVFCQDSQTVITWNPSINAFEPSTCSVGSCYNGICTTTPPPTQTACPNATDISIPFINKCIRRNYVVFGAVGVVVLLIMLKKK